MVKEAVLLAYSRTRKQYRFFHHPQKLLLQARPGYALDDLTLEEEEED